MRIFASLFVSFAILSQVSLADPFGAWTHRILRQEQQYWQSHYGRETIEALSSLSKDVPSLVIIDGLSSGADYAILARELFPAINIIHVQSTKKLSPGLKDSFREDSYDANIIFHPDKLGHLASLLSPFKISGLKIVAGTETGVKTWAVLTDALDFEAIPVFMADALNNKYLAAEAVRRFVKTIPGKAFKESSIAWDWAQAEGLAFPMILKPVNAAGSFDVKPVHSRKEFFDSFSKIIGHRNPIGKLNSAVLVQPYFSRDKFSEYVIDAVVDSETGITISDVLKYRKREHSGVIQYLSTRLVRISRSDPLYKAFLDTARGVANGLQVHEGVLHIEVFVKNGSYPAEIYFIEAGARPAGGGIPAFVRKCGGIDMITLYLYSMFDRKQFLKLISQSPHSNFEGIQIDLLGPPQKGIVTDIPTDNEFREHVTGFSSHSLHMKVGKVVDSAQDLFQGPGVIDVIGTAEQVDGAEAEIRDWEASDFYRTRNLTICEKLFFKS